MTAKTQTATSTFPLAGILGLIFITLKLVGVIDWSWWWVLSPFWIPVVIALGIFAIAGVGFLAVWATKSIRK